MKKLQQPPFKQNTIALGFTVGVHAIAIVGLLFLGLSKPPEEPKKITTVLVNPEDLPPLDKPVEVETTAENEAPEVQSPVVDNTLPENTPVTPPQPTDQQLAAEKQKSEKAEQAKLAEQKRKADEVAKEKTAADKAANDKAIADKASKDKAAADKVAKDKAAADKASKDKAAADKASKDKAAADKAAKDKAAADKASKDKAAADKAAKDKAAADKAVKDKADAEAEAKAGAAKKAEQEAAQKKADAKKIASNAKAEFTNKVKKSWKPPLGASGKTVSVRFILSDSGQVSSFRITKSSGDDAVDASIKDAVYNAEPYPMPEDKAARLEAKEVISKFTVQ